MNPTNAEIETAKGLAPPRHYERGWRTSAETAAIRSVGAAMERASWDGCRRAGAWLGLALFGALKQRRGIAISNLQLAFPHLSRAAANQIARRSAQNFAMTFCEFLHLRIASPEEIRRAASIDGLEHIESGLERGRGVILLTAHVGNWELMGARAALEFPLTVVARPTSNRGVQGHMDAVRRAAGLRVLSKYDTARATLKALRENVALGILPDQHGGYEGLLLPMFGHLTRINPAPAKLSLISGAPLVGAYGVRRRPFLSDGRIIARVLPGFDVMPLEDDRKRRKIRDESERAALVEAATRRAVTQLEGIVRAHPEQWMWLHRRWREEDFGPQSRSQIADE